jgi:hypothetical protein
MGNYIVRNLPQINLNNLLKKRKTTLSKYLSSYGIFTYTALEERCKKMGVSPPSKEEFDKVVTTTVTVPQEGVVVLDPPAIIKESTGKKIDEPVEETPLVDAVTETVDSKSKKKQKKERQEAAYTTENIFELVTKEN